MPEEKITTLNVTSQVLTNGDVCIRRRASSGMGGLVVGAMFIAFGLWMVREGVCFGWGFLVVALLPLAQSGKELQRPDVLIEKSPRRVVQQPRWPSAIPATAISGIILLKSASSFRKQGIVR